MVLQLRHGCFKPAGFEAGQISGPADQRFDESQRSLSLPKPFLAPKTDAVHAARQGSRRHCGCSSSTPVFVVYVFYEYSKLKVRRLALHIVYERFEDKSQ